MERRILLIEPPFYRLFKDTYSLNTYPMSLGYLSGMVKRETNWDVRTYNADFNLMNQDELEGGSVGHLAGAGFDNYLNNLKDISKPIWEQIGAIISEYNPHVVGISAKSQNFTSACIIAGLAKAINTKTLVVVGGPHPTMVGRDALSCPDIDICVRGEGERTIVELLHAIEMQMELAGVKGIIFRRDGQIIETASREPIESLDGLPFPHRENTSEILKDYDRYPLDAFSSIFATRGCPYNCFFCGTREIWGRNVRFRSPENVAKEIESLQNIGRSYIYFWDDTFGVRKKYIKDLCNAIIRHCPGIKWGCEIHVKLVEDETISLMRRTGSSWIYLGIESGNNEILKK